jgi:hypothetical protein
VVGLAVVCLGRYLRESGSLSLPIAAVVGSPSLPIIGVLESPLPIAAAGVCSPSLSIVGVLAHSLSVASVLGSLLVSVRLLPAAVVVGQVLGVLLLPAPHARLALRKRPSFRERSRLNPVTGFSSPHFVQRFRSSTSRGALRRRKETRINEASQGAHTRLGGR